jgi:signal transduction histidine kinase
LRASLTGLGRKTLGLWLLMFFLALAIPTAVLIRQAYSELKWEAFHQHRVMAEELSVRINGRFSELVSDEEARSFSDYAFLNVAGDPSANFLQRSPLSAYPLTSTIPGLIGYFQVDAQGVFSTPLLPPLEEGTMAYGISARERQQRLVLQNRIQQILSENRLVRSGEAEGDLTEEALADRPQRRDKRVETSAAPATVADAPASLSSVVDSAGFAARERREEQVPAQAAFDRLNAATGVREQENKQRTIGKLGRVEDLKLDDHYQADSGDAIQGPIVSKVAPAPEKRARKERSALPEPRAVFADETREATAALANRVRIELFESEIDPFEFSLLDSGHFVLFRKVWRDGQRYIQGALIEQQPFLKGTIKTLFGKTVLSQMSDLIVAYQGDVFSLFGGQPSREYLSSSEALSGALLYRTHLSDPLSDVELIFSINRLPPGPGGALINWVAAILILVLCGGFYLMYRLGAGQIELARQQQDFISAVSHELKTPLTSIRMYGEMLREGWASEEKKKTYYKYIFDESERLSRLINNVLQLARLTRNSLQAELKPVNVSTLLEGILPNISSLIEHAGFELSLDCRAEAGESLIKLDADYFTQILINLVDNALKFSSKTDNKIIDVSVRLLRNATVQFSVRDYGRGVPREQMKKIFKLFYRSENELTRETVGTGIGLALVHQLAASMNGQVDVVNAEPGAEFRVCFPVIPRESC